MASQEARSASIPRGDDSGQASAEAAMNLSLLDPPHWGWSAGGGIVDLLTPHERARRRKARNSFLKRRNHEGARTIGSAEAAAASSSSGPEVSDARPSETNGSNKISQANNSLPQTSSLAKPVEGAVAASLQALDPSSGLQIASKDRIAEPMSKSLAADLQEEEKSVGRTSQADNNTAKNVGETVPVPVATGQNLVILSTSAPSTRSVSDKQHKVIEVKAVNENGVLDMHCYHRGRQGHEPRDSETGELLCDVDQTDTNYGWEPKLTTTVTVSFPLVDETCEEGDNDCRDSSERRRQSQAYPLYRETLRWDLSDPRTPTPMSFASDVAEEFGLGFGQTLDLASSIQAQIDDFICNHAQYNAPLSFKDPYGNGRDTTALVPPSFSISPQLYGHGVSEKGGGFNSRSSAGKPRRGGAPRMSSSRRSSAESSILPSNMSAKSDGSRALKKKSVKTASAVNDTKDDDVEPEYKAEVVRRMKAESKVEIESSSRAQSKDGLIGILEVMQNHVCHICHARKPLTIQFACDKQSHSYCDNHCRTRLGFSIKNQSSAPMTLEHCPICSLECACSKCARRLNVLSHELKLRSIEQKTSATKTNFADISQFCLSVGTVRKSASVKRDSGDISVSSRKPERKVGGRKFTKTNQSVPKVPASDFPREVCGGRDLDPGSAEDYQTMFSAEGNFLLRKSMPQPGAIAALTVDGEVEEDGNVDYCQVCKKHGNLLCCDRCPRAFHRECVQAVGEQDSEWECHVCLQEKKGTEDDLVDGKESLEIVAASIVASNFSSAAAESLAVISMIHAMVSKLMKYEFGALFSAPVDSNVVVGYKDIIKKPMDLGTIASNLTNGVYVKNLEPHQTLDDAVVAVLQDLELVWHNCFTFNYQGSSIYRMAEVQRRKSNAIRKRSFDHLLSDGVKSRVNEYAVQCESQRGIIPPVGALTEERESTRRPSERNKITVPFSHGGLSRIIAVLDPGSGMITKMYRSMNGASLAAKCLSGLGYRAEYEPISDSVVKAIIHRSAKDPDELFFGYRWLFYDDLVDRKVQFVRSNGNVSLFHAPSRSDKPKLYSGLVEMTNGSARYVFISVDEALSYSELPVGAPLCELKKKLLGHPIGEAFSFFGCSWKRWLPKPSLSSNEELIDHSDEKSRQSLDIGIEMSRTLQDLRSLNAANCPKDGLAATLPTSVSIVKADIISMKILLGFETLNVAYHDWLATRRSSPGCSSTEPVEMDFFRLHYLEGDRNIDGLVWRSLPKQSRSSVVPCANGIVKEYSHSSAPPRDKAAEVGIVGTGNADTSGSEDAGTQSTGTVDACQAAYQVPDRLNSKYEAETNAPEATGKGNGSSDVLSKREESGNNSLQCNGKLGNVAKEGSLAILEDEVLSKGLPSEDSATTTCSRQSEQPPIRKRRKASGSTTSDVQSNDVENAMAKRRKSDGVMDRNARVAESMAITSA